MSPFDLAILHHLAGRTHASVPEVRTAQFKDGAEAVDTTLRRAAISGRVEVNGEVQDHWADIYTDEHTWSDMAALDADSYRALKTKWMRCKVEDRDL